MLVSLDQIQLSKNENPIKIAVVTLWQELFHDSSFSSISRSLGSKKASQRIYVVETKMTRIWLRRVVNIF